MSAHAIAAITDAFEASRAFLFPFDLRRWARLAVIVFFLSGAGGSGGGGNSWSRSISNASDAGRGGGEFLAHGLGSIPVWVWALLAAVLVLALVLGLLGAVMRYVFLDALRTDEVRIRGPMRDRLRQGAGLYAFRLGLAAVTVLPPVALAVVFWLGLSAPIAGAILGIGLFLLLAFVLAIVGGLTTDFVVPVSMAADVGVLAAWRRFWPTLRAEWQEVLVFLIVEFVLRAAIGFVAGIVILLVALPLVLAGLGGGMVGALVAGDGLVVALVALVVLIPFGVLLFVVSLAIKIPVVTYLTHYALLVLGDLAPKWDLIPERRAAIRADD